MKKAFLLAFALGTLGFSITSVKADPPMPYCPPVCAPGQKDQM